MEFGSDDVINNTKSKKILHSRWGSTWYNINVDWNVSFPQVVVECLEGTSIVSDTRRDTRGNQMGDFH